MEVKNRHMTLLINIYVNSNYLTLTNLKCFASNIVKINNN